jgi:HD-GYP domain-containing protein (c-di-GMP phosphodiesterase class II)
VSEAFEIMAGAVGRHLDPDVVGALRQVHAEGRLEELLQKDSGHAETEAKPGPYR